MVKGDRPAPQMARARRTAATSRAVSSVAGVVLTAVDSRPAALVGFGILLLTAANELRPFRFPSLDEAAGAIAALLIVGTGDQRVDAISVVWLSAAVCGILARGGRVHWAGRLILATALVLPMIATGRLEVGHAAFCAAAIGLLLGAGRVTRDFAALLVEAHRDPLTRALTRLGFCHVLDERSAAGAVGVMVIDLDGFGRINKHLGHEAGDRALVGAVARLVATLGPEVPVGRLGGDEFAVVLPVADVHDAGEQVLAALSEGPDGIGASIGIAWSPEHGRASEALLRAADVAQRVAKLAGKSQVATFDGQAVSDEGPSGPRGALDRLIAGQGLTMLVQPIVDIASGAVHAYEALARFRTRGEASPLHWFALADEYGLGAELELACLRAALPLLPACPARLSVNLSARMLTDPRVRDLLMQYDDVSRLIVEVTERSLLDDHIAALPVMRAFTERGVVFAVDDMGAGYSGLRQVTTLRPAYLKLDRLLVAGIEAAPERTAMVEALVGYAARTDSRIVAEGVETEAELAALRDLGVTLVQGYLLGRPGATWVRNTGATLT